MNVLCFWIAQASPAEVLTHSRRWNDPTKHAMILALVALGILVLGGLVYAVFIRRPGGHRRHRHHRHRHDDAERSERQGSSLEAETEDEDGEDDLEDDGNGDSGRRRRRRRREHRPRNPTLAETGGLPPVRRQPPRDDSPS